MSNRRDFIKNSVLLGAASIAPLSAAKGEKTKQIISPISSNSNTFTVNMKDAMNIQPIAPRQIDIPDTSGFKVLKGDFHMHTVFSDGHVMPADRVKEAVQNGLDAIAITDHIEYRPLFSRTGLWKLNEEQGNDYNIAYNIAKPIAEKENLLLILGTEITKFEMPPGHINVLFAKDINPIAAAVADWREMLKIAADQGSFLLWNHPGWEHEIAGGLKKGEPLRFTAEHEEVYKQGLIHGVEVFNSTEYYPIVSDWCNERDLAIFANSDIHASEFNMYGVQNLMRPITLVLAKERTVESLREAMFAKRTIAWAAGMLWGRDPWLPELFKASVKISTVNPSTLALTNKSSLPITVSLGGVVSTLPKDSRREVYYAEGVKAITVSNWMIGTNQPLEVSLDSLIV